MGIHWGNIGLILGFYGDSGEENGSYYNGAIVPLTRM